MAKLTYVFDYELLIRGLRNESRALRAESRTPWSAFNYCLLMFVLVASSTVSAPARAQPVSPGMTDLRGEEAARIVTGIVSFTRWPSEPHPIRLCVVTPAAHAAPLAQSMTSNTARPAIALEFAPADPELESGCDVVYVEALAEAQQARLFQRLAGHPVLSIGGSEDACSMGALFCLTGPQEAVSFAANLDTIVRSGLHINPKVLLLARKEGIR